MKPKALVVLSGGQDSTTCLFMAIQQYGTLNVSAVAFDYGQKHSIELDSARTIAKMAGIDLEVIDVKGLLKSVSPLTNSATKLDKYDNFQAMEAEVGTKIEKTFVPMRNSLFLTVAVNRALALGATRVVTGVCGQDNANYPDCTADFIHKIEASINESLGRIFSDNDYVRIEAPLMFLSKAQTVWESISLGNDCLKALAYSHTSYDGKYPPTDNNHSNLLRAQGFLEAGCPDPLVVRAACEGIMPLPNTSNYTHDGVREMCLCIGEDFNAFHTRTSWPE